MTKKDYQLIARIFKLTSRSNHEGGEDSILASFAQEMAETLTRHNKNFDKQKFIEACYSIQCIKK